MRSSKDPSAIGSKLGPKLVSLISDTIVSTKRKLLDTEHRARVHSMQEIIDRAGHEIADLYRPVWEAEMGDAEIPDHVKQYMAKIMSGRHQWQAIAGMALSQTGASSSLSQIISNYLASGVRFALAKDPQLVPNPEELIQLGVRGTMDWADVRSYCNGQGYADFTIDAIRNAAYSFPDVTTALELLRRQVITVPEASLFMTRAGIPADVQNHLLTLIWTPLSPADLADMVVRGIKDQEEATRTAEQSGVSADDFNSLVLDTGEPPGLMQMLEGFRRGFIDQGQLDKGIRQSRYRNEWIPLLEKLRYSPMSVADAVNAVVQNHIPMSEGESIADQNGLEPGAFGTLYETAGEPLSRTEMEDLYNRGLATEDDVKQALRESRLKDKYVGKAFDLHQKVLPIFSLQRALRYGGVDHATAIQIAMELGYTKRDAEILVNAGSAEKTQAYKNRVVSSVETAYEDNTIPKADALDLIKSMGYEQSEAEFILQSAEFRRSARIVSQVVSSLRSKYVEHKISRHQASGDLDAIGIPSAQRDFILKLWDIEYDNYVRHLTEAQVVKAVNKQLITDQQGLDRLTAMGYSQDDASLLLRGA